MLRNRQSCKRCITLLSTTQKSFINSSLSSFTWARDWEKVCYAVWLRSLSLALLGWCLFLRWWKSLFYRRSTAHRPGGFRGFYLDPFRWGIWRNRSTAFVWSNRGFRGLLLFRKWCLDPVFSLVNGLYMKAGESWPTFPTSGGTVSYIRGYISKWFLLQVES